MNVKTEFTIAKEEYVLVKLDEKQVTANQRCKSHQGYGPAAIGSRTKRKRVEVCVKPTAPKIPKHRKHGCKKPEPPVPAHSTPIPIQPKIFPSSHHQPSFQLFGVTCSSGSGISQLNHIEPVIQHKRVNRSTTGGLKILDLASLQSHCDSQVSCLDHLKPSSSSCDGSLVLNTGGNSVLFQVCGSNFSPHENGSSNAVASQLSGVLLNTNELVSCQVDPRETNPFQLGQIQIQRAPLFQSSLAPVGVGLLSKNTKKVPVQIQMTIKQQDQLGGTCFAVQNRPSLSPVVPCHFETPLHHNNFLSVSNSSLLNSPMPSKLKSISPKIVIQDLASSSVQVVGNSETLAVNSQHVRRGVDARKIANAPTVSSKRRASKNKSKDQALWCSDVKPGSPTCLKNNGIQGHKGKTSRHLNSYPVTAKNSTFVQPLLIEHSKFAPMQTSELSSKNVKSKRRGRQKRIVLKRCVPVPIRPKVTPRFDDTTEIQRSVNECQASSVFQPIKIEIASCDMKSCGQDSCIRKLEYSRANGSHVLMSQSSDFQSVLEKCITSNSLNSISSESSILGEIQKKLKFCKTAEIPPSNQNLLNREDVEYNTSLHTCTAVNTSSDTVSPSLSMLPMHVYKTPSISARDPVTILPRYVPVACNDEDVDGRDKQNSSARRFSLKRRTTCQKPEKPAFILDSGGRFDNHEKTSNCSSVLVQNAKRKNLALTSLSEAGSPAISDSDHADETFGSKCRSNVSQQRPQKLPRFVPILPRPTNNHMCIFSQAVGHRGRRLWDRLFKKNLARKRNRGLSAPRQNVSNKQQRRRKRKLERNADEN